MDGVSVAASILSVTEVGAKLSLTLYRVANRYRMAAKDIQSVAKNIALFAAVLKDLGRVLEQGKKLSLYRPEAYDNCYALVRECDDVFASIRKGLKVDEAVDEAADEKGKGKLSVDKTMKLLWIVNKPKVEHWQVWLESLKATVLVQLAVLKYGERISAGDDASVVGLADMLALKAVILADDTARKEYHALVAEGKEVHTDDADKSPALASVQGMNADIVASQSALEDGSVASENAVMNFTCTNKDSAPTDELPPTHTSAAHEPDNLVPSEPSEVRLGDISDLYRSLWTTPDIVEHAIRKVDSVEWEYQRLQENRWYIDNAATSKQTKPPLVILVQRLSQRLNNFNLSEQDKQTILQNVQGHCGHQQVGLRQQLRLGLRSDLEPIKPYSQNYRQKLTPDKSNPQRWIPDLVDDILWEHACNMLGIRPSRDTDSRLLVHSGSEGSGDSNRPSTQAINADPEIDLEHFALPSHEQAQHSLPLKSPPRSKSFYLQNPVPTSVAVTSTPRYKSPALGGEESSNRSHGFVEDGEHFDMANEPDPYEPDLEFDFLFNSNMPDEPDLFEAELEAGFDADWSMAWQEKNEGDAGGVSESHGNVNFSLSGDGGGIGENIQTILFTEEFFSQGKEMPAKRRRAKSISSELPKKAKLMSPELRDDREGRMTRRRSGEEILSDGSQHGFHITDNSYDDLSRRESDLLPSSPLSVIELPASFTPPAQSNSRSTERLPLDSVGSSPDLSRQVPGPISASPSDPHIDHFSYTNLPVPATTVDVEQTMDASLDQSLSPSLGGSKDLDWAGSRAEYLLRRYTFITPA